MLGSERSAVTVWSTNVALPSRDASGGTAVPAAEDNQSVGARSCARIAVVGSAGRSVSSRTGSGTSMSPVAEIA